MKIDPHNSKQAYLRWKAATATGIPGISDASSEALLTYLVDMEIGRNIGRGSKKGGRGYIRLNTLRYKLVRFAEIVESNGIASLTAMTEREAHNLFAALRSGAIPRKDGGVYRSTGNFVKAFRAFWHWHMKVQRQQGVLVDDICVDLDSSTEKPPWVYLTLDDVRQLCDHAKFEYRVLMTFLFDTGIRSPTELVNVRVSDLQDRRTKLSIRDETSKTFGRTINLLLSTDLLGKYIQQRQLGPDDQLFPIRAIVANRYLKRLALRVLGDRQTRGGSSIARLTMYDFRHSSACYWLPRYKSESALKYRFGWKRSEMIHYYTEFLGMKDTITEEDLFTGTEKSTFERKAEQAESEKRQLEDELAAMQLQMKEVLSVVSKLVQKVG